MKNPDTRSPQEEVFLQLFLKIKHASIFSEFDKGAIKLFVKKLSVHVYNPGDIVQKKGETAQNCVFVMEGELETSDVTFTDERQRSIDPLDMTPFDPQTQE